MEVLPALGVLDRDREVLVLARRNLPAVTSDPFKGKLSIKHRSELLEGSPSFGGRILPLQGRRQTPFS